MALLLGEADYSPPELVAKIKDIATRPTGPTAPKLLLYMYTNESTITLPEKAIGAAARMSSCWLGNLIAIAIILFGTGIFH
jgi:hypothetical protein